MWRSARILDWSLRCSRPFSSIAASRCGTHCLAKNKGTQMISILPTRNFDLTLLRNYADSGKKVEKVAEEEIGRGNEPKEIEFDDKGRAVIYVGDLAGSLKRIKFFSLMTSTMGLVMMGKLVSVGEDYSLPAMIAIGTVSCIFTFISPVFIELLSRRYITQILYDAEVDKYTFVTQNFFHMRREFTLSVDKVVSPDVPMSPFSNLVITITELGRTLQKPVFVNPPSFIDKAHYIRFMRYHKPVDLKIDKLGTPEEISPVQIEEQVKQKAGN